MLVWDPESGPVELGCHDAGMIAAALPDGGWPATGANGCGCGMCRAIRPAVCSYVPRSLPRRPIWRPHVHLSCKGQDFMLGGARSGTEHTWRVGIGSLLLGPGNAASVRALLAAGFILLGFLQLFHRACRYRSSATSHGEPDRRAITGRHQAARNMLGRLVPPVNSYLATASHIGQR